MKKPKLLSIVLSSLGIGMISIAFMVQNNATYGAEEKHHEIKKEQVNVKSIATANRKEKQETKKEEGKETIILPDGSAEQTVVEPPVPERIEVFEGMTIEELSAKLDRNLGDLLVGKGNLIATKSLEKGIDPYIAVAIMLHETGCGHGTCSGLTRSCNNVGGQKGYPSCSGGYKGYPTLDEGIIGFIDNLYNNYYAKGLTTIDSIGPRYAQSRAWPGKIHAYVNSIRAN